MLGSWSMMDFKLELLHEYCPFVVILRLARAATGFCGSAKININFFSKFIASINCIIIIIIVHTHEPGFKAKLLLQGTLSRW